MSAILGLSIAIGGVVFIGWGDIGISADNLKGDLLSVGGTVAVAMHMLIGQKACSAHALIPVQLDSFLISGWCVCHIQSDYGDFLFQLSCERVGDFPIASSGSYGVWSYFI